MKREKKALLIAMVMGDGYIHKRDKSLVICHSADQEVYLRYKRDLLHSILGGKRPNISFYKHLGIYPQYRFSKSHRYFRVLRNWMYPNKYKHLKYMTPHSLAIWFMDDGSLIVNNRFQDGTPRSYRTNIHTGCSKGVALQICEYFKNSWDIKFTPFKERGTYSIRCFHKEGQKFHELIHPFIIPEMSYKQRGYYPRAHSPVLSGDEIV